MTATKIPITELHMMARQMKMGDFINWFAEKYMNIPSTAVKPDIYLTLEEPDFKGECDDCGWKHPDKYDCLCPENCDEIEDRWKPIEPVVQEIGITKKSCENYFGPKRLYKEGDVVRIKDANWYEVMKDKDGFIGSNPIYPKVFYPAQQAFLGCTAKIKSVREMNDGKHWYYHLDIDNGTWHWHDYMFV